jgi:hypothetical protein
MGERLVAVQGQLAMVPLGEVSPPLLGEIGQKTAVWA